MAIVNRTEDSFYPKSRAGSPEAAAERALAAAEAGAAIIDFGGESTRPGAAYVPAEEEIRRIIPAIRAFRRHSPLPVSVDTRKAEVARLALEAGADMINDISALKDDPAMGPLCAEWKAAVVLMHKKGIPLNMQDEPRYADVVREVSAYLAGAAERAGSWGIAADHIILDPGIGFGKRLRDNLDLLARLEEIRGLGYPILLGLSRKSFIGELTGRESGERLAGTMAANTWGLIAGAKILRVHDVAETADLIKVIRGIIRRK
jgi:dihydropteroate synthase